MRLGTKSLLWGCHQFLLHPIFTFVGWVLLYGWGTLSVPILLAIIIHDWGYWGCREMDGHDGVCHPIRFMGRFESHSWSQAMWEQIWRHSRHMCKELGDTPSDLCWADKLGTALMPSVLWATLAYVSGEGWEYMANPHGHDYVTTQTPNLAGLWRFHREYRHMWGRSGTRWGDDTDLTPKVIHVSFGETDLPELYK